MEIAFCSACNQSIPAKDAESWKNDGGEPLCKVCHYAIRREETRVWKASQEQIRTQIANKIAALSLVGALTLAGILFGVHSCRIQAEEEREQRIQKILRETRAEFEASIDSTLSEVETKLRNRGREKRKARERARMTYPLGTATQMMRELLRRNPKIAEFLAANPDKRAALERFLQSKARAGVPFDLKWDDGNHRFR